MERAFTLANTPLNLQIAIFIFLHPSDILALRKTCKTLELATRKRIVWVSALHRVCLDNTLFLPSFPILDMSDLELERAAMAPRRWIEICEAFQKQHSNDTSEILHPRTTRIIEHRDSSHFFIVPGGRYMVTAGDDGIYVWDLGYVSTVDCKLVASIGLGYKFFYFDVQATPNGKGLVILSSYIPNHLSIFEIYPQSEIPLLTQIAHLGFFPFEKPTNLSPDKLICCGFLENKLFFRVVDYRTNYATCFSSDVDITKIRVAGGSCHVQAYATKTAIIVLGIDEILIWAIPPLSPQHSDIYYSLKNDSTIPPLLKIPFPDDIVRHSHRILGHMTFSSWYLGSGSLESVYFDFLYTSRRQRFKIIIKPDLSDASFHIINTFEYIRRSDLTISFGQYGLYGEYRVCDDALVYVWNNSCRETWGAFTGLTSAPFTDVVTRLNGYVESLCPISGRFVYYIYGDFNSRGGMAVVDLF